MPDVFLEDTLKILWPGPCLGGVATYIFKLWFLIPDSFNLQLAPPIKKKKNVSYILPDSPKKLGKGGGGAIQS